MQITKKHIIFYSLGTLLVFLVCLAVFFILIPTSSVFAVEIPKSTSDDYIIATNPENQLLNVKNMAPGDKPSAPLTVINKGKKDFSFNISAELENGDTLYNELDLTITYPQNNSPLYSGKLSGLKDLNLGRLDSSENETFNIAVSLPSEAGNEFQGIYTSVKFVLTPFPISQSDNNKHIQDSKSDHTVSVSPIVKMSGEWSPGVKVRGTWNIQDDITASKITHIISVSDKSVLTDAKGNPISGESQAYRDFEKHLKIDLYYPSNSRTPVYSGSLEQLQKNPQVLDNVICLSKETSQTVGYEISMDTDAGNELRGVKGVLNFQLGTEQVENNYFDSPFSDSDYSMKLGSTTPIKFECYNADGKLVGTKQDVKLVITGGNLGQGLTYTLGNGSMSFDAGHYKANVAADSKHFKAGEKYTATVYISSTKYCQKTFEVATGSNKPEIR